MLMMTREQRIAMAISRSGKKKGVIAQETGISAGALSQWLSGDTKAMKPENLAAFAHSTGVRMEWIATGAGAMLKPSQDIRALNSVELTVLAGSQYPIHKEIVLETGERMIQKTDKTAYISRDTLERVGADLESIEVVEFENDSMMPLIQPRALTAFDKSKKQIKSGKIYALDHGGIYRIRKVEVVPTGYKLIALNGDYKDEEYTTEAFNAAFEVKGWVCWWENFASW